MSTSVQSRAERCGGCGAIECERRTGGGGGVERVDAKDGDGAGVCVLGGSGDAGVEERGGDGEVDEEEDE